jgi:hypothetical protein
MIDDSEAALDTAVKQAALLDKNPCYVCLLLSTYKLAKKAGTICTTLITNVQQRFPDIGNFNCDKVNNFTKEDMQAPNLTDGLECN